MGYTHHFYLQQTIDPAAWERICADARKLFAATHVSLAFDADVPAKPPFLDDNVIRFNGVGELGCETFYFERDMARRDRGFCKTLHLPYDVIVCATLAVIAEHAGAAVRLESDGSAFLHWKPPLAWASKVLGRTVPVPDLTPSLL